MAERLVLLTRPLDQSRAVARELRAEGIESLIWPLTRIVMSEGSPEVRTDVEALLFTSANGARAFAALNGTRDLPVLCVGGATADVARSEGFTDVRSAEGDASALAAMACESGFRRFMHPRGADIAGDLRGVLATHGIAVDEAVVYRAEEAGPPSPDVAAALARGQVAVVTVWSPRGASILERRLAGANLASMALVAISPAAAAPLARSGFGALRIAENPSREALLAEIFAYFQGKPA